MPKPLPWLLSSAGRRGNWGINVRAIWKAEVNNLKAGLVRVSINCHLSSAYLATGTVHRLSPLRSDTGVLEIERAARSTVSWSFVHSCVYHLRLYTGNVGICQWAYARLWVMFGSLNTVIEHCYSALVSVGDDVMISRPASGVCIKFQHHVYTSILRMTSCIQLLCQKFVSCSSQPSLYKSI